MQDTYTILNEHLRANYDEINGYDFYRYIFPNNENKGEFNTDYSKPNAVYLYKDNEENKPTRTLRRRIMLNDTWESDYIEYVEENSMTLCSGLSYRGRTNKITNAQKMNALVFDLDNVGLDELKILLSRFGREPLSIRALPIPTFIVLSGTGLHIYYVLDRPIDLYPNIKLQLKALKYALTFIMWDYKSTSKNKQIQYQSINQGFRMVGSINSKYGTEVKAYKIGDKVSLKYLNSYVKEEKRVDINKPFRPSKITRAEAKEKYPEWYQRVVVEKKQSKKKWHIKKDLYNWWLNKATEVKGGHRYFYLMCVVIYAVKCDVSKEQLEKDLYKVYEVLKEKEHTNPLTERDIISALETYSKEYYNFTISDIEYLTDIRIERNKRNYRPQKQHLERARAVQNIDYPNGEWRNGNGRHSKIEVVKLWRMDNPNGTKAECIRETKLSKKTVYKWW